MATPQGDLESYRDIPSQQTDNGAVSPSLGLRSKRQSYKNKRNVLIAANVCLWLLLVAFSLHRQWAAEEARVQLNTSVKLKLGDFIRVQDREMNSPMYRVETYADCTRGVVGSKIGQGDQGGVFDFIALPPFFAEKHTLPPPRWGSGSYVVKTERLKDLKYGIDMFLNEVDLQDKAAEAGVAPKVITGWVCVVWPQKGKFGEGESGEYGFLVMERERFTLDRFMRWLYAKARTTLENGDEKRARAYAAVAEDVELSMIGNVEILIENDIGHNDVKFDNFALDFDGSVKIFDFGLATTITGSRQPWSKDPLTFEEKSKALMQQLVYLNVPIPQGYVFGSSIEHARKVKVSKQLVDEFVADTQ